MKKPFAITLDVATSRANHTGAWRTQRPEYIERTSPCDHACPAGGVQSYLDEGRSAEFTATCVGTPDHNGFYGEGIVNALGVVG